MASQWLFEGDEPPQENAEKSKQEELFVFGYGCKVFRDDDQARLVDAGKYLIPWMGDEKLLIDRYDGRGHLYDLAPYDADSRKRPKDELSEEEKKMEALCDEERYLELHTDLAEKTMYEEEEWKRYYESLSEGYKAVGFSYDYHGQPYGYTEEAVKEEDPEDLPYVAPPELAVPKGVQLPETNREAAIIEKTAKFIASQGAQMEIMMKTKQANNATFLFMHFEDTLHPYYRHVVKMIKSGKFKPKVEETPEEPEHEDEGDGPHSYLHPALLQTNRASPTPEVYKPIEIQMPKVSIHETSYGQLLKSMSRVNQEAAEKMKKCAEQKLHPLSYTDGDMGSQCQQDQHKSRYVPHIICDSGLGAKMSVLFACLIKRNLRPYVKSNKKLDIQKNPLNETVLSSTQNIRKKYRPKEVKKEIKSEPHDDLLLSAGYDNGVPPPPGIEPVTLPQNLENGDSKDGEVKTEGLDDMNGSLPMDHSHLSHIVPPPPDVQPVVDRMAMYVAKNGVEFEIVVKSKKDPRFDFLHSWHVHFAYYDFKKQLFIQELAKERKEKEKEMENEKEKETEEEQENEEKEKSGGVGIKFKVKVKDQEPVTLEKKTVFENESSDEEEHDGETSEKEKSRKSGTSTPIVENAHITDPKSEVDPAAAERKLAEQRMRDRIAASAREKLSQVDKEKQLQAERKRKAAMFINLLKSNNTEAGAAEANDVAMAALSERLTSQTPSGTATPLSADKISSRHQKSKSKHKRKDKRSRSPEKSRSRDRRSRSRDRRSRSKSPQSKKKKRKRSATPPSAYSVVRRSPMRFPLPPPPRYQSRDRSPLNSRSSRLRSKSRSPSRPKSKKKKRSRSRSGSRSKSKDTKSHSKTSKKKKKKRSRSRSPKRKATRTKAIDKDVEIVEPEISVPPDDRVNSPAAVESELEEGETRETTPEPGEIKEEDTFILSEVRGSSPEMIQSESRSRSRTRTKSRSRTPVSVKSNHDKYPSESQNSSPSRHTTPENRSSHSRHSSRSSSRHSSPLSPRRASSTERPERTPSPGSPKKRSPSPESKAASPTPEASALGSPAKQPDCDSSNSGTNTPRSSSATGPKKNVSQYMLNRVRAIIKASREAVLQEDRLFMDDS